MMGNCERRYVLGVLCQYETAVRILSGDPLTAVKTVMVGRQPVCSQSSARAALRE